MPASGSWRADRPGDLGAIQPRGALLGSPGPNVGYALTLANRAKDRLRLEAHESADDATAVIAAIAMKRAATFGRAPTVNDVDFAMELLGYLGDAAADVREWRPDVVRAAGHDYVVRRAVVDTVGSGLLRLPISELPENLAIVREAMARAAEEAAAADEGSDVDLGEPEGDVNAADDWDVADGQDPDAAAAADPESGAPESDAPTDHA
jgi:hypothetical protein